MREGDSATELLGALFDQVLEERAAFIEIRRLTRGRQDFFPSIAELERALPRFLQDESDILQIYFGVNPRSRANGGREDVACAVTLHLDLDFKNTAREAAERRLLEFPFRPSAVVTSGYGLHVYWLLDEPAEADDFDAVEAANHGLARHFGGDSCWDLARVLRSPGTHNLKYGRRVPVELLELHPERRYGLGDFELVARPAPRPVPAVVFADVSTELPIRFQRMVDHPDGKLLREVWEGRYVPREPQKSRSARDMKLANLCAYYGLTKEEIAGVLVHFPYGRGREATPEYLGRTIAKAMEKHHG